MNCVIHQALKSRSSMIFCIHCKTRCLRHKHNLTQQIVSFKYVPMVMKIHYLHELKFQVQYACYLRLCCKSQSGITYYTSLCTGPSDETIYLNTIDQLTLNHTNIVGSFYTTYIWMLEILESLVFGLYVSLTRREFFLIIPVHTARAGACIF